MASKIKNLMKSEVDTNRPTQKPQKLEAFKEVPKLFLLPLLQGFEVSFPSHGLHHILLIHVVITDFFMVFLAIKYVFHMLRFPTNHV